ncbi:MAG: NYN domain-containing protein [Anaerolineae bacterium]|nr:NYN domain-containing protein [Anaerolineae bacterium]
MTTKRRLALLIDADNAQASLIPQIMAEVGKQWDIIIRRAYGNWTTPQLSNWKKVINTYALSAEHQFSSTPGKNSTDIALTIAAMDIMYDDTVDGICIVSSDSDYAGLAKRIREKNLFVMGIGRSTTPEAFRNACDRFITTESLPAESGKKTSVPASKTTTKAATATKPKKPAAVSNQATQVATETKQKKAAAAPKTTAKPATEPKKKTTPPAKLKGLIQDAFVEVAQEDGWAHLGAVGAALRKLDPDFDPHTYEHKQLSQLFEAFPDFIEVKRKGKGGLDVHIRLKDDDKPTK